MECRREHDRIPCDLRCWCESEQTTAYLKMANVSRGGCFIRTAIPFTPGDHVVVSFTTPGYQAISVEAEVVWAVTTPDMRTTMNTGMGLKFLHFVQGEQGFQGWIDC